MDVFSAILGVAWVVPVLVVVAVAILVGLYVKSRWKVARADEALIITGGKKGMHIRVAGGGFVSPFKKFQFFPLGVMTVRSANQETQSKTLIPVVVQWTAQLRPNTEADEALKAAVVGFIDRTTDEIKDSLQQTLDGEIRAVVATLTPQEVVTNKEGFSAQVSSNVQERMNELGFKLISLNIAEVSDRNNYYNNLSAEDRENQRKTAETLTANANREVAVAQAASDRISESAKLDRNLAIAEKNREVTLREAQIKAETDQAETDAEYAGQLKAQDREAELAARRGQVKVVEQQQAQAEAIARREVAVANAETARREKEIVAEADARKREIDAEAAANVAKRQAIAEAAAEVDRARGKAQSINVTATADAERTRVAGLAEAEVARAKGEADAAATLAKGRADAEVQTLMAQALAANEGANLRVTLAEMQRDTQITVYTELGKAMARIGENAQFIDMGGSSRDGGGDLLTNVLGNVPRLLKRLDIESDALHGTSLGSLIGSTAAAVRNGEGNGSSNGDGSSTGDDVRQDRAALADGDGSGGGATAATSTPAASKDS